MLIQTLSLIFILQFIVRITEGWNHCCCGHKTPIRVDALVIDGEDAQPYQHPWAVSIQEYDKFGWFHMCGGTLITESFVLTSGDCSLMIYLLERFRVAVGKFNLALREPGELYCKIKFAHHHYNLSENNLGVIKLAVDVPISTASPYKIVPICLPDKDMSNFNGMECRLASWGLTNSSTEWGGLPSADILQQVAMKYLVKDNCNYSAVELPTNYACGVIETQARIEEGDLGSGFVCSLANRSVLVGVLSKAFEMYPEVAILTPVGQYREWIIQRMEWIDGGEFEIPRRL